MDGEDTLHMGEDILHMEHTLWDAENYNRFDMQIILPGNEAPYIHC